MDSFSWTHQFGPARNNFSQHCADTMCDLDNQPNAMAHGRERKRERERERERKRERENESILSVFTPIFIMMLMIEMHWK